MRSYNEFISFFYKYNMKITLFFVILMFSLQSINAQPPTRKTLILTNADADGDGIQDLNGQDKCPSTLSQIQGRRATTINEVDGKNVIVRLPDNLANYLYQERVVIDDEIKLLRNKQAEFRREVKRADEKYGKYANMKSKERKAEMAKFDSLVAQQQTKIDEANTRLKAVNANSYIEFIGNIEDKDQKIIQKTATIRIRLNVDIFGCLPDDDKDGSPNMVDECPEFVGTVETSGCPDRDGDKIPDKLDKCPDVPGPKDSFGCPDRDKDGVPDGDDQCPDTKGLVELNGCPDRDGDGIPDIKDDCPDVKGTIELKGCPDRDGDGITDKDDKCPDVKGIKEFDGCPDTDKDGVQDKLDDCPFVPGPKENKGCPKILEKASKVQFESSKAVILKGSYPLLDELAKLLSEYPDATISLAGHTDDEGDDASNLQLSKDRANAVKDYLIGKGIEASRITSATGFGESKPIASNTTPAGKALNRRVEMKLSNRQK
ncbi:MAG: OmpA family protein [Cytophagales bacterium]|nr:MAG: OmpA family protein [Cytophagales bacterium]